MTETPTLAQRLRALASGRTEWRVQHPETGTYCIAYSNNDGYSINPELSAREWLSNHQRDYPNSQFAGYVVKSVIVQTAAQKAMDEAAADLESQAAQIAGLTQELASTTEVLKDCAAENRAALVRIFAQAQQIAERDAQIAEQAAQIEALRASAELWCGLYKRAINEANGLTNYVEDRPELRSAERKLEAIETEARAAMAAKGEK